MKNDFSIYIPFQKAGSAQIVEGVASSESLDSQGEVIAYEAMKKALPNYLGDYDSTKNRFQFGNIREMHQPSAVGKTVKAFLDEKKKQLIIAAKVVDQNAWKKVQEGVYAGFSIGGRVIKQVGNEITEMTLSEISLVDRPANPDALFSLVKFDKKGGDNMDLDVKKDVTGDVEDTRIDHNEVYRAANLLSIAADLCFLYDMYEMNGLDATNLDKAVQLLKDVVAGEMSDASEEDKETAQKMVSVLEDFQKKKLTAEERNNLKDSDFAYIDSKGGRHLPIHDEAHIKAAMARFSQTQFESSSAKATAARKIIAAAKKAGIEVDPDSGVSSAAKRAHFEESAFIVKSDAWVSSYFTQQKQVLG